MLTPIRISNAASLKLAYTAVQYPSKSPFNCDCSKLLLLEPSNVSLWGFNGAGYTRNITIPRVGDSSEPLWSRTDPNVFYYHTIGGNTLYSYNVSTVLQKSLHTFSEYIQITGKGETAMSEDGQHIALIGDNRYVFTYNIATDQKSAVLDILPNGLDSIYITPGNGVLISWATNGSARYRGIEYFDANMNFVRQIATANGHKGVCRDTNGDEICVWTNSAENPVTLPNFQNGIIKIRLADGKQTGLLALDWSLAVHVSCPRKSGFAIVETYDPQNPVSTKSMANAVLQVPLDGSATTMLLKHGSNSATYEGQPRTSVSDDGSRFVYGSNMGGMTTDVYYAALGAPGPSPVPPAPIPATIPMVNFPNQQPLTEANFPAAAGQAGFVYDGTATTKIVFNDGAHKWVWTGTQVQNLRK